MVFARCFGILALVFLTGYGCDKSAAVKTSPAAAVSSSAEPRGKPQAKLPT
ncbi:MAG: hypothetical protein HY300_07015, partial [Verrucomicrobia bacterium]|nr:hypothetical protein [Verrucomicrobiota bacterium]